MTKEVLIHIISRQSLRDSQGHRLEQEEPIELITTGEYYYRNNTHYLLYEESIEGYQEPTHNMLKLRPGMMEVRKRGVINVQMIFEPDKKTAAYYRTPYGTMELEIAAWGVTLEKTKEGMKILANYSLGMNQNPAADCEMEIRITPKGERISLFSDGNPVEI